jgi:hypothetical protein
MTGPGCFRYVPTPSRAWSTACTGQCRPHGDRYCHGSLNPWHQGSERQLIGLLGQILHLGCWHLTTSHRSHLLLIHTFIWTANGQLLVCYTHCHVITCDRLYSLGVSQIGFIWTTLICPLPVFYLQYYKRQKKFIWSHSSVYTAYA